MPKRFKFLRSETLTFSVYSYIFTYVSKPLQILCKNAKKKVQLTCTYYLVDVLCRQQIKLFQVVSTAEFHEY